MGEVGGAVQRIDDPARGRRIAAVIAAFFGQDAVAGIAGAQAGDDQILGSFVELGHQIGTDALTAGRMTGVRPDA